MVPAKKVATYANKAVNASILPAFEPISPIAIVTNPKMISGMQKERNWLKVALKVMKMRLSQWGMVFASVGMEIRFYIGLLGCLFK